jgi:diguanylate cyclase (GGDEF)-like protein
MAMDHQELLASFEGLLKRRNLVGLRLGSLLISLIFPLFWVLDWVVMPNWAMVTLWLRLFAMLYSLAVWIATFRHHELLYRHANSVGISLGLLIGWLIAVMAWLDDGYESPYYAGLNLVILGASFLFAWPLRISLLFSVLLYCFYMAPLLIDFLGIDDLGVAITNQFFLLATILVCLIAQQHRLVQERKDYVGIQRHRALLQQAEVLAVTDPLTGLYNRRQLFTLGMYELSRARRLRQSLSALAIDIDHFKQINDSYGHLMGDEVLKAAAHSLQTSLRQGDILTRIGGDEFIILLPAADIREAALVADRIQFAIDRLSIQTPTLPLSVTVSIGVAPLTEEIVDLDGLLRRTDEVLYRAKHAGRACVQIWSLDPQLSLSTD